MVRCNIFRALPSKDRSFVCLGDDEEEPPPATRRGRLMTFWGRVDWALVILWCSLRGWTGLFWPHLFYFWEVVKQISGYEKTCVMTESAGTAHGVVERSKKGGGGWGGGQTRVETKFWFAEGLGGVSWVHVREHEGPTKVGFSYVNSAKNWWKCVGGQRCERRSRNCKCWI